MKYVYFIKPVGMDGPVKIGCSHNPASRLTTLATWSPFPLEIVATVPGGRDLERNIHQCFADLYSHREWFKADKRLTKAIRLLKKGASVEVAIDLNNKRGKLPTHGGGQFWSELTRQRMSVLTKVRFAMKRINVPNHYCTPPHISDLVHLASKQKLTEAELAVIDEFTANPEPWAEVCNAVFREWSERWRSPQPHPSEAVQQ